MSRWGREALSIFREGVLRRPARGLSSRYALGAGRGKVPFMAIPLAHKLTFLLLDPATLSVPPVEAAVHQTARLSRARLR